MDRNTLFGCLKEAYGTEPEYPWMRNPGYAILRHGDSRKWYAVIMNLPGRRLGLNTDEEIDVINLKCDPLLMGSLLGEAGVFPGYHMSKEHWITVMLDSPFSKEQLFGLIELSHNLTKGRQIARHHG